MSRMDKILIKIEMLEVIGRKKVEMIEEIVDRIYWW